MHPPLFRPANRSFRLPQLSSRTALLPRAVGSTRCACFRRHALNLGDGGAIDDWRRRQGGTSLEPGSGVINVLP